MQSLAPRREEPCGETRWGLSSVESFWGVQWAASWAGAASSSPAAGEAAAAWALWMGTWPGDKGRDYLPLLSIPTCSVQFWTPQYRRNIKNLEWVQWRAAWNFDIFSDSKKPCEEHLHMFYGLVEWVYKDRMNYRGVGEKRAFSLSSRFCVTVSFPL